MPLRLFLLAIAVLSLLSGCARQPGTGITTLRPATLGELRGHLLAHAPDVDQFRLRGPFEVTVHKDREMQLSAKERVVADLYLSAPTEKAPLVILLHGHGNSKDDHAYQALHLATWGMHAMTLQLPSEGPWVANGRTLARVVAYVQGHADVLDGRIIDVGRIVLAGHSFGGAAVAVALAENAPATGGVLLDPAGFVREVGKFLRQVRKPVIVVASDEGMSRTRGRGLFYELIPRGIAEVSIRDAHHEDGEFPLEAGPDSAGTEELQITFVSALTSAAFSLAFTGQIDYAWRSFGEALRDGKMMDALRK